MLVDTSDSLVVVILESSANNPVVFSLRSMAVLVGRAKLLKAGEGRENAGRLGREQLEKPPARPGGFFESVRTPAFGSFRLVQNVRASIKYFGYLPWESFEGLDKSSPQNKIKISKKR